MELKDYQLSDIIYALSFRLDRVHDSVLQELAQPELKDEFIRQTQYHFVEEYQKELFTSTNLINEVKIPNQEEVDIIFTEFAKYFHKHGQKDYFLNRGITEEEIITYKLGSTHIIYDYETTVPFIESLKEKYNKELVEQIIFFHLRAHNAIKSLHDSEAFVTIPDFDINGICRGIVYRAEKFVKTENLRNMHKFFVSHAPLFWFNSKVIDKYDTLIVVEGVFDALALLRIGIKNVISPSATRISKYEYEKIKDKKLHLVYDRDAGGVFGLELFFNEYDNDLRNFETTYDVLDDSRDFDEITAEEIFGFFNKNNIQYYLK